MTTPEKMEEISRLTREKFGEEKPLVNKVQFLPWPEGEDQEPAKPKT